MAYLWITIVKLRRCNQLRPCPRHYLLIQAATHRLVWKQIKLWRFYIFAYGFVAVVVRFKSDMRRQTVTMHMHVIGVAGHIKWIGILRCNGVSVIIRHGIVLPDRPGDAGTKSVICPWVFIIDTWLVVIQAMLISADTNTSNVSSTKSGIYRANAGLSGPFLCHSVILLLCHSIIDFHGLSTTNRIEQFAQLNIKFLIELIDGLA